MMNKRGGDFEYNNMYASGGKRAKGGLGNKPGMRIMVPSKMAGSLIGKGGANIQRLRTQFNCNVRIPDCPGPERIMEITAEEWESVYDCLGSAVPWLYECPEGIDDGGQKELRFLVHQTVVGGVIGKGGEKIKDIRAKSGTNVKVYQNPAPMSTDRCIQVNGSLDKLLIAAREIYEVVQNTDSSSGVEYDPINFDSFFASEYGGFGGGADPRKIGAPRGRGAPPGRGGLPMRGAPPMGLRGDGMGPPRGAYGAYDAGFVMDDGLGYPPARGRGGFGPRGGGFGRGGFGMGFGEAEWGGGFGGGAGGGGGGPELSFTKETPENSQVTISNDIAGAIIGPGGQRIRKIRNDSKATVTIGEPDSVTKERVITITGEDTAVQSAEYLIQQTVREHSSGYAGGYDGY